MTREGRNAFGLTVISAGLFGAWLLWVGSTDIRRPTFVSDPVHAALVLGAAGTAILGGLAGLMAFVGYGERSPLVGMSILLGVGASYWTYLEFFGG